MRAKQRALKDIVDAFTIFGKYAIYVSSEDPIYEALWGTVDGDVCVDIDPDTVSSEDKQRLKELGWVDDEDGTFYFNSHVVWIADD